MKLNFKELIMIDKIKELLSNAEYRNISDLVIAIKTKLKENNMVIVYGQSDDIICFYGLFSDEFYAYSDTTILIDKLGIIPEDNSDIDTEEGLQSYLNRKKDNVKLNIEMFKNGQTINIKTDYENSFSFDIKEYDEVYGNGLLIVF